MANERVEYIFEPSTDLPISQIDHNTEDSPYFWRQKGSLPENPVTVRELTTALSSAIANKKSRAKLNNLLTMYMSAPTIQRNGENERNIDIVSQEVNGVNYPLSPSSVQTIMSVLTVMHDSGIDYDFAVNRDGAIEMKVKDNLGSSVLLVDPVNPHLIGQVVTRNEKYWSPSLSDLTFSKADEYEKKKDKSFDDYSLLQEFSEKGPAVSPYTKSKTGKVSVRNHDKRLTHIRLNQKNQDKDLIAKTVEVSRARYMGLDQRTKDTLALTSMVKTLGLNPETLSDYYQELLGDMKVDSIYRFSGFDMRFRAEINLGRREANIAPVYKVGSDGNDAIIKPVNMDGVEGDININLQSGIVGNDRSGSRSSNPSINPNQLSEYEALACVHVAYRNARVDYLKMLTGPNQENVDKNAYKDQQYFKRILSNELQDEVLAENGISIEKVNREPLDVESQEEVLKALKNGLLLATADIDGVNDSELRSQRVKLQQSTNNPYVRARRLEVFDGLVGMMNKNFGNAPLIDSVELDNAYDLSYLEYERQLSQTISHYNDEIKESNMSKFQEKSDKLRNLVLESFDLEDNYLTEDELVKMVDSMSYREMVDTLVETKPELVDEFKAEYDSMIKDLPLDKTLNISQVTRYSSEGTNATAYGFMLTSAVARTEYTPYLVGNNEYDSLLTQERSVMFDADSQKFIKQAVVGDLSVHEDVYGMKDQEFVESTAKSAQMLRDEDLNPESEEYKLRQYLEEVKSGKREFSFDDPENPNPKAFKHDGSGFIRDISPNEFKARVLDTVAEELRSHGAIVEDGDVLIDDLGVVKFKANIPLIDSFSKEQVRGGITYAKYSDDLDPERFKNVNGFKTTVDTNNVYLDRKASDDEPRFQPIEGTFGQIFAPGHDGLVVTKYNRYDEFSQDLGQFAYQPKYVGSYNMPDRLPNGDWDKEALRRELHSGLGHNERLRAKSYDFIVRREVSQAVNTLVSTSSIGNVSEYNSNTSLNKTLHGEVYGSRVEAHKLQEPVSELGQRIKETELNAVRLEDSIGLATGTTSLITYMSEFQKEYVNMRKNGEFTDPTNEEECYLDVVCKMKDPAVIYGGHSYANLSHESENLYFSDNMTGQGGMFGKLRYFIDGVKVDESGKVHPNAFRNPDGSYVLDENGKVVGYGSGTPVENAERLDGIGKNPADRKQPSIEQTIKAQHNLSNVRIAGSNAGAATMEDGCVISKAFAERYPVFDEVDEHNNPIYRPLKVGDKVSDTGGNKATISEIIDPDMPLDEASSKTLLDTVQLFKQNPDLDMLMTCTSQLSRNNGGTGYNYLTNESSKPMTFKRVLPDGNGNFAETGEVVQTNSTINLGDLIITNQTVGHKVTLYDDSSSGRKLSMLLNNANNAKGATYIANWHHKEDDKLRTFRAYSLSTGTDVSIDGFSIADFDAVAEETSLVTFSIPEYEIEKINGAYLKPTRTNEFQNQRKNKFQSLDDKGQLQASDQQFLSFMQTVLHRGSHIVSNSDMLNENRYNAGADALAQFPDGGVLQLKDDILLQTATGEKTDKIYILPERLRRNIESLDGSVSVSDFNVSYQNLGMKLAQHEMLVRTSKEIQLASSPEMQKQINQYFADSLNIQQSYDRVVNEAERLSMGQETSKYAYFRNNILGGYSRETVTSQLSSNPALNLDTIEVSPAIAKSLGLEQGEDGFAHVKDHPEWDRIHVHRDPVWREQGALGFRVKINEDIASTRMSPITAALLDADFDGDNVGLFLPADDEAQRELREVMPMDKYMLDNSQEETLLNINAELVDIAANVNNEYSITTVDGDVISGRLHDDDFKRSVMTSVRPDLQKAEWFDNDGNVTPESLESMNPGKFLMLMSNHEIKTHYDNEDYVGARQKMDEIVQLSRGFDVQRDVSGEVVLSEGDVSMYHNDGADYTSPETLRASLKRYVDEGAKGSDSAIDGLFGYIEKPLFSELKELGQAQFVDGKFNPEAQKAYHDKLNIIHDSASREAIANKIKSDMTGVPGSLQQKLTAVLNGSPEELHAAAAIGQGATQKILSIKRDVVGAAFTSEMLQSVLGEVYRGQLPKDKLPLFSLVGPQSEGLLGDDPAFVSIRAMNALNTKIYDEKNPENVGFFGHYTKSSATLSDEQLLKLADAVNMDLDVNNERQKNGFIETLDKAKTPYISPELESKLIERLAYSRGISVDEVVFPANQEDVGGKLPMVKDEFVELLDILYNDKELGLGLDVEKSNFEMLGNKLVGSDGNIQSIDDYISNSAELLSRVNMNGVKAVYSELNEQERTGQKLPLFGKENSEVRDLYFAGMSDAELAKELSFEVEMTPDLDVSKTNQQDMLATFHSDYLREVVDNRQNFANENGYGTLFSSIKERSLIDRAKEREQEDTAGNVDMSAILDGSYKAECVVEGVKCDTIQDQMSRRFFVEAQSKITIPTEILDTMQVQRNRGLNMLAQEYEKQTGEPLMTPDRVRDNLRESFVLQMSTHPVVGDAILESAQSNSELLNAHKWSESIKESVETYSEMAETKPEQTKRQSTQYSQTSPYEFENNDKKESTTTKGNDKPYSYTKEVISGDVWSPVDFDYKHKNEKVHVSGGTVNGVVASALLEVAKLETNNSVPESIQKQIEDANKSANNHSEKLAVGVNDLRSFYSEKMNGAELLNEVKMPALLTNSYYLQMVQNPDMISAFEKANNDKDLKPNRKQSIEHALKFYKEKHPDVSQQSKTSSQVDKSAQVSAGLQR